MCSYWFDVDGYNFYSDLFELGRNEQWAIKIYVGLTLSGYIYMRQLRVITIKITKAVCSAETNTNVTQIQINKLLNITQCNVSCFYLSFGVSIEFHRKYSTVTIN